MSSLGRVGARRAFARPVAPPCTRVTSSAYSTTTLREQLQSQQPPSYAIIPKDDHGPFKEYSVIHTDRSLNLMSDPFQTVMRDLNQLLKYTYQAHKVVIVPGYVLYCIWLC